MTMTSLPILLPPCSLASPGYGNYPECWTACQDAECAKPNDPTWTGGCPEYVDAAITTWLQLGGRRIDDANGYESAESESRFRSVSHAAGSAAHRNGPAAALTKRGAGMGWQQGRHLAVVSDFGCTHVRCCRYRQQSAVGFAITHSSVPREDIFCERSQAWSR